MTRNLASWKLLEDMMLELRKSGTTIPDKVIEDLRSSKSMIRLGCMPGGGDAIQKAEELMANVEAFVVTEGLAVFGEEKIDRMLRNLEDANVEVCETCGKPSLVEDKFVTGVPRDQKWVRIEPMGYITAGNVEQFAEEQSLQFKKQPDGKLVVYGQTENLKTFLKKMAAQKPKQ